MITEQKTEKKVVLEDEILKEVYKVRQDNAEKYSSLDEYYKHLLEIEKQFEKKIVSE